MDVGDLDGDGLAGGQVVGRGLLADDGVAAATFAWLDLHRQVRVRGTVARVSDAESDDYFSSRPRESQIGAWASLQSAALESREALEDRYRQFEQEFAGRDVPRPPFWGGYRVVPESVEFWRHHDDRLHDRIRYVRSGDGWRRDS